MQVAKRQVDPPDSEMPSRLGKYIIALTGGGKRALSDPQRRGELGAAEMKSYEPI
jgi:hypothetical protein